MTDTRAAGYIRVSTEEQRKHGWNLGADRERIERTVAERGWPLHAIYDDGGKQGDDPTRPGFTQMLAEAGEFDVLIMRDLDRFSRKLAIYAAAVDDLLEAGVMLYEFEGDGTGLRQLNLADEDDRALADVKAVFAQLEKAKTKRRVRQAVQARARAGRHLGVAPYGYRFEDKQLVIVVKEAAIVERIYADYVRGSSQRAIARALTDDRVPSAGGGAWRQSAVARILANVVNMGKVAHRGEVSDGSHDAIVSEELWRRAEARRTQGHGFKGGRYPDAPFLLVGGVLRCGRCGEALVCRKGRPGQGRPRYECFGRKEYGTEFCDQPSIRRELVDEPFLASLLNGYVDLEATAKRIEERTRSAVALARQAVADAEADVARIENAIATTERDYDAGEITGRQYSAREARLTDELDGARNALERAAQHAQETQTAGLVGDAEQRLLEHLAAVRRAVADGAGDAPDLDALRNVIGQMFESIVLMHGFAVPPANLVRRGVIPSEADVGEPPSVAGREGYWLLPMLAWSAVDRATFSPARQELPITDLQTSPSASQIDAIAEALFEPIPIEVRHG